MTIPAHGELALVALLIVTTLTIMISFGINLVVYLIYKQKINLYLMIILPAMGLSVMSLLAITLNFLLKINGWTLLTISRTVLQAALMAFFTAAPMFWCDILKITLGKYRIIFFSADILYAAVSLAIIFLYVSRGDLLLIKAFENSNMLAQEMLNTFVVTIVFFRLNNIVNRFLRYSLLLINIIIAIYIPVYLFEYFRYGTFFSPVIFILAFNVLFIIPTLFNAGRMNLTEEKGIPDHFISSHNITDREKEIIIFLLNGLSYSEISDRLFISDKTVETHVYNIYRKTGVKNRIQLFRLISPGLK